MRRELRWVISRKPTLGVSLRWLNDFIRNYIPYRGSIVDVSWAVVQRSQGGSHLLDARLLTYGIDMQDSSMEEIESLL